MSLISICYVWASSRFLYSNPACTFYPAPTKNILVYIKDMPKLAKHFCKLFADDTKLISIIRNLNDQKMLQEDVNNLVDWSKTWQMEFKDNKLLNQVKENCNYLIWVFIILHRRVLLQHSQLCLTTAGQNYKNLLRLLMPKFWSPNK